MFDINGLFCLSEYVLNSSGSIDLQPQAASGRMRLSNRFRRLLWIGVAALFVISLLGMVFEFADANEAETTSIEFAVRRVLNRRRSIDLSIDNPTAGLLNQQRAEDEKVDENTRGKVENNELSDEGGNNGNEGSDDEDTTEAQPDVKASMFCLIGAVFSLHTLLVEHLKWDPKSFQRFSVATKIPVEIFCVSGPLVLVSAIIYSILAGLLYIGGGSSSAFFISASWSAIMVDMSFVCYSNAIYEIMTNRVDLVLHIVNLVTVYNAFTQLRFFPYTFVICGLSFWGVVIGIRCMRRFRAGEVRASNTIVFRPGSP
jgi:hypothetical protein